MVKENDKLEWMLQTKETRQFFAKSTWVTLRESNTHKQGNHEEIGFIEEYFGCYSVAFPPSYKKEDEYLTWSEFGGMEVLPYAHNDGYYSPIETYELIDKEPIGVNLVFDHPQPVIGGKKWIINPDLIVALRLVKEGNNWVRPEENFAIVIKEELDLEGDYISIKIKKEFLLDYLAARGLFLRLSYYRQRVENIDDLSASPYYSLQNIQEFRDGGRFEILIRNLKDVYGGSWYLMRIWRTDIDENDDAPIMPEETNENTQYEQKEGTMGNDYTGVRVESEFWRNEWIEHKGQSIRVRGDVDVNLPNFIVETDGSRMPSSELNNEDIGRWLWFRPSIINELLNCRGFKLYWYTAQTGAIHSTSGYKTHFGINNSDLITVYAYDIAKLDSWEQHLWAGHNVSPDGKVSSELLDSQVKVKPANTYAVEDLLIKYLSLLERDFFKKYNKPLFSHSIDEQAIQKISRFHSVDKPSLLRLAKDLVRIFTDRLNVKTLKEISQNKDKDNLGSIKLFQDIVSQKIGDEKARELFSHIVGIYDMRLGDAHPTSSKIDAAIKLAGIDENLSYLRQGEQLIHNLQRSISYIGYVLFELDKRIKR
ncbi:hypothetical protein ACLSZ3_09305 [Avibacterium gallinarum]|uniref:Uncharacterized protein n=1 Tax=Avibacterium gallinarum TaxID=755 RepID=A0A379AXW9_AVIGA|nr:hypothetical protein [Avibacterium gallinarum]POY43719.1 hypothetical protein C3007_08885 [Avibacterium gallinarum]TDP27277.1 hypothetical protein EV689_11517 [Avibacterium gallinarum]SUB27053.1 Uncharacterised protein [Avibacterium gallinarum]